MSLVVDASVALKWVLEEVGSDEAFALRTEQMIAPVLWLAEAGNALWRRARAGTITAEQAARRFSELQMSPLVSLPVEPHLAKALDLAMTLDHPIYDCIYLALAVHHETHVVTADRRFAAIGDRPEMGGRVRLLGS